MTTESERPTAGASVFKDKKMDGEIMVHRLRDWETGETIWGYDIVGSGVSSGKTFKRGDDGLVGGEMKFSEAIETRMEQHLEMAEPPCVGFVWCATIERTRTEGRDPADPGEPPLKYAEVSDVVVKSKVEKT